MIDNEENTQPVLDELTQVEVTTEIPETAESLNLASPTEPVVKQGPPEGYRLPFQEFDALASDTVLSGPGGKVNLSAAKDHILKDATAEAKTKEGVSAQTRLKNERLESTTASTWPDGRFDENVSNDKNIEQASMYEGKPVHIQQLGLRLEEEGEIKGVIASRHVSEGIGAGKPVKICCWHSGFSFTVGNFDNMSSFRLSSMLQEARDEVGTNTAGLLYSTDDVHTNTLIIDHILEHVTKCSIKGWNLDIIRKHLKTRDLGWVMTGGLESKYPNGYPFIRECANSFRDDNKCKYSTLSNAQRLEDVVKLDFKRACLKNADKFTRPMVRQMAAANDSLTLEQVIAYQDSLDDHNGFPDISGPINDRGLTQQKVIIADPSYDLYRSEGLGWVGDVISIVDSVLETSSDISPAQMVAKRKALMEEYMNSVSCQRLSPWVKEIVTNGPSGMHNITDRDAIIDALSAYSRVSTIRDNFINLVEDIKTTHQYSFTCLPNYICPACSESQDEDLHQEFNLIPINVAVYFFATAVMNISLRD